MEIRENIIGLNNIINVKEIQVYDERSDGKYEGKVVNLIIKLYGGSLKTPLLTIALDPDEYEFLNSNLMDYNEDVGMEDMNKVVEMEDMNKVVERLLYLRAVSANRDLTDEQFDEYYMLRVKLHNHLNPENQMEYDTDG